SWRSPSKRTLANRGERWRTMRPRTSKPLVGILGDVDGRIVPVAPPPVLNLASGLWRRFRYSQESPGLASCGYDGTTDGITFLSGVDFSAHYSFRNSG